jgi:hypothetical protein
MTQTIHHLAADAFMVSRKLAILRARFEVRYLNMKRSNGGNQSAAAKRKIENVSEWDAASLEGQLA